MVIEFQLTRSVGSVTENKLADTIVLSFHLTRSVGSVTTEYNTNKFFKTISTHTLCGERDVAVGN